MTAMRFMKYQTAIIFNIKSIQTSNMRKKKQKSLNPLANIIVVIKQNEHPTKHHYKMIRAGKN